MSKLSTALRLLKSSRNGLLIAAIENLYFLFPDKLYLQLLYRLRMGRKLDLKNPKRFSEKLQWLKLFNRKPEYTTMVDKYAVKEYVARFIGEEHIIPTLGVWDRPEEIDFDSLPNQFVLKTTHGGGGTGVVICKDKTTFDKADAIRKLKHSMKANIYGKLREWPYKNVPKRVIAEKYMSDGSNELEEQLRDYKFFCFNGIPKVFKIDFDRTIDHHANYFDCTGKLMPFGEKAFPPIFDRGIKAPANLPKMIEIVEQLSSDKVFMRVDLYESEQRIYFGEITFYPASGFGPFEPEEWDLIIGDWLDI